MQVNTLAAWCVQPRCAASAAGCAAACGRRRPESTCCWRWARNNSRATPSHRAGASSLIGCAAPSRLLSAFQREPVHHRISHMSVATSCSCAVPSHLTQVCRYNLLVRTAGPPAPFPSANHLEYGLSRYAHEPSLCDRRRPLHRLQWCFPTYGYVSHFRAMNHQEVIVKQFACNLQNCRRTRLALRVRAPAVHHCERQARRLRRAVRALPAAARSGWRAARGGVLARAWRLRARARRRRHAARELPARVRRGQRARP